MVEQFKILIRRNTTYDWARINPVLLNGEPGLDINTRVLKMGDGFNRWSELEEYPTTLQVEQLITNALSDYSVGSDPGLTDHINSPLPHPIYDEDNGPSLSLLYENAKV